MAFDVEAARKDGYSEQEIADHLASRTKFDAAKARTDGWSDAEIIQHLVTNKVQRPETLGEEAKRAISPKTAGRYWKRAAGNTARTLTEWATEIPTLISDIPAHIANAVTGEMPYSMAQQRDNLLTPAYGRPETPGEQAINFISRGAAGAGTVPAIAPRFANVASQTGRNVAGVLAQRPALQTISGATGAGAGEIARQQGVGPVGQTAAMLAGAIAPAVVAPRAPVPLPITPQPAAVAGAGAGARAGASATVTPGVAGAQAGVNGQATINARGGIMQRPLGPDPSAGLTPGQQRLIPRAGELGFRLTPGQATGSRSLQQLEASLESQPWSSGPFNTLKANNARALNRAVARSIGEESDTLDDSVLGRAADRMGAVFDNAGDDAPRQINTTQTRQVMEGVLNDVRGMGGAAEGVFENALVKDVIAAAERGTATGQQLAALSSKLGKAAYKQMSTASGDRDLGAALYTVKDHVDDLLAQGMAPERLQEFLAVRGQYRNLMRLTEQVGVVNTAKGDVSGRSLANVLHRKDRSGYALGRNHSDMYDAARIAQAFQPIVGDSGTATRMPITGITDLGARLVFNPLVRAYTSSPGVRLATGTQAGARAVAAAGRNAVQPISPYDVPYGGLFSQWDQ